MERTLEPTSTLQASRNAPRYPFIMRNAHFSRSFVSPFVITLLFLVWRLYTSFQAVDQQTAMLKTQMQRECSDLEHLTMEYVNLQTTLALKANDFYLRTANQVIERSLLLVMDVMRVVTRIFAQVLGMLASVISCLLQAVIAVALKFVQAILGALLEFTDRVVEGGVAIANAGASAVEAIGEGFRRVFDPNGTPVQIQRVEKPSLPFDLQEQLQNAKSPKLDFLPKLLEEAIHAPVDKLRAQLEANMDAFRVTEALLQVPPARNVTFCSEEQLQFDTLDAMADSFKVILWICIGLTFAAILVSVAVKCVVVWRQFAWYETRVEHMAEEHKYHAYALDAGMIHQIYHSLSRGAIAERSRKWVTKWGKGDAGRRRLRWTLDYMLHLPSLMCIAIGLFGLTLGFLQLHGINEMERVYIPQIRDNVNQTAYAMLHEVNSAVQNQTEQTVLDANAALDRHQDAFNHAAFTPLHEYVQHLNETFTQFQETTMAETTARFLFPMFGDFVAEFAECFFSTRIDAFLEILQLLEHLRLDLPRFQLNMFQISRERLDRKAQRVQIVLLGDPDGVEGGGEVGVIPLFLEQWRLRAMQEVWFSLCSVLFGLMIWVQAWIVYFWYAFRRP